MQQSRLTQPEFDSVTKAADSKNVKMADNVAIQDNIRRDIHEKLRRRTLGSIEDDVDRNIDAETEVWLDLEVYENLKRVF